MRKASPPRKKKNAGRWLLLVHQLPAKPAYLRVKVWRRLQDLGAVAVKNSVYVLPSGDQSLEDFQWLLQEIERCGGEGMVCEAELVDGLRDEQVRALFDAARDNDYAQLTKELRSVKGQRRAKGQPDLKLQLDRLRQRFDAIAARDFFGATGRMTVEGLLSELERRADAERNAKAPQLTEDAHPVKSLKGRTWVTRQGVFVDRIACAWLIRRFIDEKATFRFVQEKTYRHNPGELRFDMFKGEFTHQGDKCSFEVLVDALPGKGDSALKAIGEIVHDIDLKDEKFGRDETMGVAHVLSGICASHGQDETRIARGSAVFDDMYAQFRTRKR
jgi:hypothetical protein